MSVYCEPAFFTRLPYDIREIIYLSLVSEDLPPFAATVSRDIIGFFLSCRQARREIQELGTKYLNRFIRQFQSSFEQSTGLKIDVVSETKSVTVTLPQQALENFHCDSDSVKWKRDTLAGVHVLLEKYFDVVRIHLPIKDAIPSKEDISLYERSHVETMMHSLLRDLSYMMTSVTRQRPALSSELGPHRIRLDAIFSSGGSNSSLYPVKIVRTKRICISWDFHSEADGSAATLNGKIHCGTFAEGLNNIKDRPDKSILATQNLVAYLSQGSPLPAAQAEDYAAFYHICDPQRLAGETGLISMTNWTVKAEYWFFSSLMNGIVTKNSYCSSKGFGQGLKEGLEGISEKDFADEEKKVSRLLYNT